MSPTTKRYLTNFYNPVLGAILNILFWGLADILTANILVGLIKIFLSLAGFPILLGGFANWIGNIFDSDLVTTLTINLLIFVYIIGAAVDGFRTFERVQKIFLEKP